MALANYQPLSDKQLIERYLDTPSDLSAFNELWKRHEPTIRKYASHLCRMCPHFYSRDLFFEDVFSSTQEKILRGLRTYQGKVPFSGWLWGIADRAAISRRRELLGRGSQKREFVELTEQDLVQRGTVFWDKVKRDPVRNAIESEVKGLLDDIMYDHAASEEGYRSIAAIIFNVVYDYKVREVATLLGTYERGVHRLFAKDYPRLRTALAQRGIRCVRDALSGQE